jgi:Outer membrane receptor proteins, mostly Fe transport
MRIFFTVLFVTVGIFYALPQGYSVKGFIHDAENNTYLPAARVSLMPANRHQQTDKDGFFSFENLSRDNYLLRVQFIGYDDLSIPLTLTRDTLLHIHLHPASFMLSEVTVNAQSSEHDNILLSLSVEEIGRTYLLQHNSTNFVKTLASIPGISSMDIGAGFSKPVIRGFGFNRVAVVDKGIVQQNQQWGADHGLEIDQYDVDNVRVHKGPMSLLFGSDAIGGVIEILASNVPRSDMFWGDATLISKSNNDLYGASVMASWKKGRWFVRGRATAQNYGDYRIPVDTITYLTWKMPVHNRRMKNTAGNEYNFSLSTNYDDGKVNSWMHISNIYAKNGFFPGSHGIPSLSRLEPDASVRNVEMPYATSNHFKLISNTTRQFNTSKLYIDIGYQQNRRAEISQFHTHYGNQPAPVVNPDLELHFLLHTYSANIRLATDEEKKWSKTVGVSTEYQHNRVGGYSFLLPDFNRFSAGAYWLNRLKLNERFSLTGGIRYDAGTLSVEGFFDPLLADYLEMQDYTEEDIFFYAQRADDLRKTFSDFSGSVGFAYTPNSRHTLKMNIGKSFRYPSANELASNGVHHGAFRHEKGNPGLRSEKGYQLDMDYRYSSRKFTLTLNPFASYFSNYIYLEPSGTWSILPHTGQIYEYRRAKTLMAGGEAIVHYAFDSTWSVSSDLEYVYNLNSTDGYPLPFSPPTVITTDLTYSGNGRKALVQYMLQVENQWILSQNRIAKNEEKTPGTNLWHLSANMHWNIQGMRFITDFQIDNLLNRAFLNHLSFYRKLNAPEPGRNIQLILKIPF